MALCNNLISLIVLINVLLQISKCNGFHVLYKQLSNIPSKHSIKFDVLYSTRIHHEQTNLPKSNFIKLKLIEFKVLNDIGTTGLYYYLFFNLASTLFLIKRIPVPDIKENQSMYT